MTTMLEKAARAACDYISSNDPDFETWDNIAPENRTEYAGLVRAVLMAVKDDPGVDACNMGQWHADMVDGASARSTFTAMIDHILNEGKSDV